MGRTLAAVLGAALVGVLVGVGMAASAQEPAPATQCAAFPILAAIPKAAERGPAGQWFEGSVEQFGVVPAGWTAVGGGVDAAQWQAVDRRVAYVIACRPAP